MRCAGCSLRRPGLTGHSARPPSWSARKLRIPRSAACTRGPRAGPRRSICRRSRTTSPSAPRATRERRAICSPPRCRRSPGHSPPTWAVAVAPWSRATIRCGASSPPSRAPSPCRSPSSISPARSRASWRRSRPRRPGCSSAPKSPSSGRRANSGSSTPAPWPISGAARTRSQDFLRSAWPHPPLSEHLAPHFGQEAREALSWIAARVAAEPAVDWDTLALAVRESAERVALAICGDPAAAISIVCAETGGGLERPEVARLARFAVSEEHLAIRAR